MFTCGCAASSARPASARQGATCTGTPARRRSSKGSSPTSRGSLPGCTGRQARLARPCPRETMPGRQPRASRCCATASVAGVLPAPPATTLPITMTGTGRRCGTARACRRAASAPYSRESGQSATAKGPRRCQAAVRVRSRAARMERGCESEAGNGAGNRAATRAATRAGPPCGREAGRAVRGVANLRRAKERGRAWIA